VRDAELFFGLIQRGRAGIIGGDELQSWGAGDGREMSVHRDDAAAHYTDSFHAVILAQFVLH
jgi:hypothetical protein